MFCLCFQVNLRWGVHEKASAQVLHDFAEHHDQRMDKITLSLARELARKKKRDISFHLIPAEPIFGTIANPRFRKITSPRGPPVFSYMDNVTVTTAFITTMYNIEALWVTSPIPLTLPNPPKPRPHGYSWTDDEFSPSVDGNFLPKQEPVDNQLVMSTCEPDVPRICCIKGPLTGESYPSTLAPTKRLTSGAMQKITPNEAPIMARQQTSSPQTMAKRYGDSSPLCRPTTTMDSTAVAQVNISSNLRGNCIPSNEWVIP